MATNPIVNLDFDTIKSDIIAFYRADPTFTDYNFEGSALNTLIDILAFNTHSNAYYANMLHSEGFIDTAQKRASVVSRAKELGYTPTSANCSTAYIDITAIGVASGTTHITLSRGTAFTSSNDNGTYNFVVADNMSSTVVSGNHIFTAVKLINGIQNINYFKVDTVSNVRSLFTIPNKKVDTKTLKVYVRESINSTTRVEYSLGSDLFTLDPLSKVFFIQESYDGSYQIYFGNNVLGVQPVNGNIIDIDYFVVDAYELADGCRTFGFDGTIGTASTININTTQVAFGGKTIEDINSVKTNALKSNTAKHRTVTVSDYELTLKENFPYIKSVAVWGGESNIPPVYGKVFISVQPVSGYTISDAIKRDVLVPMIRGKSLLTIIPEFIDPNYSLLEFTTKIKFNPAKSITTQSQVEGYIKAAIEDYISLISEFNTDYLESNLISKLSNVDSGIISVNLSKYVGFKVSPLIGIQTTFSRNMNNAIVPDTIKSTKFNIIENNIQIPVTIKEVPNKSSTVTSSSGAIQTLHTLGLYTDLGALKSEIGTVNLSTGQFDFAVSVYSYLTANRFIQISCLFDSADILTSRNQILALDTISNDTSIGLLGNNVVITEVYEK
jgi:hypothetical protein